MKGLRLRCLEAVKRSLGSDVDASVNLAANYRYDFVDDIIDPRDTRAALVRALDALRHKVVSLPKRRNGNPPQ